jgi:hypothetical protein
MFSRKNAKDVEEFDPHEFEDAREVVGAVSEEYAECEKVDYIEPIGQSGIATSMGQMNLGAYS